MAAGVRAGAEGGAAAIGRVRRVNEDSYLISPSLYAVADGMGGHGSGDLASALPGKSYIRVVDTVGSVTANRADIGSRTARYLRSPLPGEGRYLTAGFAGATPAPPTLPASPLPPPRTSSGLPPASARPPTTARRPAAARAPTPPGTALRERVDLPDVTATAEVTAIRWAVVVLSASFDPGWSVPVDGRPVATEMVAPALVAVTVPPGTHQVVFRYHGFAAYPELLALALLSLLAVARETGGFRLARAAGRGHQTP